MSDLCRAELLESVRSRRAALKGDLAPEEAEAVANRQREWLEVNRAAIAFSNAWVKKHGLPLAKYRMF
jgi:antitoxin CcdA